MFINSETGDVDVRWGEPGTYDPVRALKLPEVIKAIGRGMAPSKAIKLLEDDWFFRLVDLKEFVGKRSNQQRRVRARIIGSQGKIRKLIENLTGSEITIYGSTVVVVGEEDGLESAVDAIERLASGSEHGPVIKGLEKSRKRQKMQSRSLEYIEEKGEFSEFDVLVPGLSDVAAKRASRRLKAAQVDPNDEEQVAAVMEMAEDESVTWGEE
jgi:ribosomal RNA assembly protein